MKEKVEKLSKDLINFVTGTKSLDKLIGVKKSFYDITSLGFNKNPKKVFQKPNKVRRLKGNAPRWGHQTSKCYTKRSIPFRKVTNTQGPKKQWVPKNLLLFDAGMYAPQQEKRVVVLGKWMLQAYD